MPAPPPPMPERVHDVKISRVRQVWLRAGGECAAGGIRRQPAAALGDARDCDYCYHEVRRTQADLIKDGYDKEQVEQLAGLYRRRWLRGGVTRYGRRQFAWKRREYLNRATRQIRVTEHYIRMDYEGDGKPRHYRVTTAGSGRDSEAQGQAGDRP